MTNTISKMTEQTFNPYFLGKIYKIVSNNTDLIYIGSTTKELKWRFSVHKSNYKYKKQFLSVFEIFDKGDCKIELLEDYPCYSRYELEKREGWYQTNTTDCINTFIAGRRNGKVKKKKIDKGKKHNCECGGFYYDTTKERHMKTMSHKKLLEVKIRGKMMITCECGVEMKKSRYFQHENSDIHFFYLAKKNNKNLNKSFQF